MMTEQTRLRPPQGPSTCLRPLVKERLRVAWQGLS
jgi:hypothetical protein